MGDMKKLVMIALLLSTSRLWAVPLGQQKIMPIRYSNTFTADGNPPFDLDKLLFLKRQTYHSSHFYTDFIDGCTRYGNPGGSPLVPRGSTPATQPKFSNGTEH